MGALELDDRHVDAVRLLDPGVEAVPLRGSRGRRAAPAAEERLHPLAVGVLDPHRQPLARAHPEADERLRVFAVVAIRREDGETYVPAIGERVSFAPSAIANATAVAASRAKTTALGKTRPRDPDSTLPAAALSG